MTAKNAPPANTGSSTAVDWNAIQARMDRLGVLRYQKERLSNGGVCVQLLLPTTDPTKAQPVEARADTEAAAVLLALQASEDWAKNRR